MKKSVKKINNKLEILKPFLLSSVTSLIALSLLAACTKKENINIEDTFEIIETKENTAECDLYKKYFFKDQKVVKAYNNFGIYYVKNNIDGEYLKRYLPPEKEKYEVNRELSGNKSVIVAYNIMPKIKSVREGKKVDFELVVDNVSNYFKMREVKGGTEMYECVQKDPSKLKESMIINVKK